MNTQQLPGAIFIMGPTASGKTDLAIELAQRFPCELISVDSALIYRGMDIGTAKPSAEVLAAYPHHLVDIIDPVESYSAAQFRQDALALMAQATAKGRVPVLVGGTMLYYKALLEGLATMPPADAQVRAALEVRAVEQGLDALHEQLQQVDPGSAARIHPNDSQRVMRALEVWLVSGISMTEHRLRQKNSQLHKTQLPYNVAAFAIAPQQRSVLHQRIEQRFQQMVEQGFIDEVRALQQRGDLHAELPSMRSVGYRQVWDYLLNQYEYDEMLAKGIAATRQLAKRQFTWLRSWQELTWLDSLDDNKLAVTLKKLQQGSILQ